MRLVHIYPKPGEMLKEQRAGDSVRALSLTSKLRTFGFEVLHAEGANVRSAAGAAKTYKRTLRGWLPNSLVFFLRDIIRVSFTRRLGRQIALQYVGQDIDAIIETHDPLSLAGVVAARGLGVPLILDDAAPIFEASTMAGIGWSRLHSKVFRAVTEEASVIVAVNQSMRHELIAAGITENKITIIENGVDIERFDAVRKPALLSRSENANAGATVFAFIGSFQAYHRTDLLIQAFSRMKNTRSRLLLAGDGKNFEQCRKLVEQLNLSKRVHFLGRVNNDVVPEILAQADVGVLPATNSYGNPMKLYEYLAAGLPIIAPDQDTVREVAGVGQEALLFKPEDVGSLAQAMDLLASNRDRRKNMACQARAIASNNAWSARAKKLARLIGGAIEPRVAACEANNNPVC